MLEAKRVRERSRERCRQAEELLAHVMETVWLFSSGGSVADLHERAAAFPEWAAAYQLAHADEMAALGRHDRVERAERLAARERDAAARERSLGYKPRR